jgi:hypothetical protein
MEGGPERAAETGLSGTLDFGGRPRFRGLASSTAAELAIKILMEIVMRMHRRAMADASNVPSSGTIPESSPRSSDRLRLIPRGLDWAMPEEGIGCPK